MRDHHAMPWRHGYFIDNALRRLVHRPERLLGAYVKPGMTVLDVGCGMGHFSIGMARMVGDEGRVIAVDVQQVMLDVLRGRAERAGVAGRIRCHRSEGDSLGIEDAVDFALTFWVVHEASDAESLLREVRACMKPDAKLLLAEPMFVVSARDFDYIVQAAQAAGLQQCGSPRVLMCRAAVFEKA